MKTRIQTTSLSFFTLVIQSLLLVTAPQIVRGQNLKNPFPFDSKLNDKIVWEAFNSHPVGPYYLNDAYFDFEEDQKQQELESSLRGQKDEVTRSYYKLRAQYLDRRRSQIETVKTQHSYLQPQSSVSIPLPPEVLSMIPLVPFRILNASLEKSPVLYFLINKILFDILTTPTGNQICRQVGTGQLSSALMDLGISKETAEALSKHNCQIQSTPLRGHFFTGSRQLSDGLADLWINSFQNFKFLIFEEPVNLPFESWTGVSSFARNSSMDSSIVVIDPKSIGLSYLYRTIAHELIMRLDHRAQSFPFDILKNVDQVGRTCEVAAALSHPQIRITLNTIRALKSETKILMELGMNDQDQMLDFSKQSCLDQVSKILPFTTEFGFTYRNWPSIEHSFLQENCRLNSTNIDFSKLPDLLEMGLRTNGQEFTVCSAMTEEMQVSSNVKRYDQVIFSPGPRPPIGRGTGSSASSQLNSNTFMKQPSSEADWDKLNVLNSVHPKKPFGLQNEFKIKEIAVPLKR